MSRTINYGNKVVVIVETYEDVQSPYRTKHMPKYLNIEYKKYEFKIQIQNHRIKMYVTKGVEMINNIDSIYAKIWGHCTEPLQNMVKNLNKSTVEHKKNDVIWLPKNFKTVSTGIDSIGNKRVNYFNTLKSFVNM